MVRPVLLVPVALIASCSLTSDHLVCTFEDPSGAVTSCGEWSDVALQYRTTIEAFCRAGGHELGTGACPDANRVGGCREESADGTGVTWHYASADVTTLADVAAQCDEGQTVVGPDGVEVDVGSGLCSVPGAGSVVVLTFRNETAAPVSLYVRDEACDEGYRATLAAGGIDGNSTTDGQVWVVRAGDQDPTGDILLELQAETSDVVVID